MYFSCALTCCLYRCATFPVMRHAVMYGVLSVFVFTEVFFLHAPKPFFWTSRSHGYGRAGEERGVVANRQLYSFADKRIMSSKDAKKCQVPHTADSDELAHAPGCTAVNHKLGQVSPLAGSWTNLRALYGTPPRIILSQCFHHNLFIRLSQLWTWGEDMQPRGIAPNQQIISKALWNILFKSVTDCVLPDMRAECRAVVDAVGSSFFTELGVIFVKMFKMLFFFFFFFLCFGVACVYMRLLLSSVWTLSLDSDVNKCPFARRGA